MFYTDVYLGMYVKKPKKPPRHQSMLVISRHPWALLEASVVFLFGRRPLLLTQITLHFAGDKACCNPSC